MKTFVILLERDEQRKKYVNEIQIPELENKGHKVEIFPAIDAKNTEALMSAFNRNKIKFTKPLQAGAYGCFLSHYEIWKKIAQGQEEFVLVIEDDAKMTEYFQYFDDLVKEIDKETDMVYIYTCIAQQKKEEDMKKIPGKTFLVEPYYTWCTLSYIISKKCAQYLIDNMNTVSMPIDEELCRFYWNKMKVYLTNKNFFSSLGQNTLLENINETKNFKSNIHGTPYILINYN